MSHYAHDAVIATCHGYVFRDGYEKAGRIVVPDVEAFRASLPEEWQPLVIGPVPGMINDFVTWAFLPDGSKEGLEESDRGDMYRDQFANLFSGCYEGGSTPFNVVRVHFEQAGGEMFVNAEPCHLPQAAEDF